MSDKVWALRRLRTLCTLRTARSSRPWAQETESVGASVGEVERSSPIYAWTREGIEDRVAHALVCAGYEKPTEVQRQSARAVQAAGATLIAAETGAGKTYAYLAPILSSLRKDELNGIPRLEQRPRAVILAPTRELVWQVREAAARVSRGVAVIRAHTGGPLRGVARRALLQPVDMLVATPFALARLRRERGVFLSQVRHAVLDEADVLLRDGGDFTEAVDALFASLRATGDREQRDIRYAYAAASVPQSVRDALQLRHGDMLSVVQTKQLHRAPDVRRVRSVFMCVNGEEAKFKRTAAIVQAQLKESPNSRVMVFCDRQHRRRRLADLLCEQLAIPVAHICARRDMNERESAWQSFRDRAQTGTPANQDEARVAVCAQSYGRGIDHTGVEAVVLVDMPMTGTEFLHRAGRIRGRGTVFALVNRRERSMGAALYLATCRGDRVAGVTAQRAREQYPGGVPSPLTAADAMAVRETRKMVVWKKAIGSGRRPRRR